MNALYSLVLFAFIGLGCANVLPSTRIYGGSKAKEGQFPFMVSIRNKESLQHICGGAILNKKWVVTAANCLVDVTPNDIVLTAASIKLSKTEETYDISQIVLHPSYEHPVKNYDVGVLQVSTEFNFENTQILNAYLYFDDIIEDVKVTAIGYNKDSVLEFLEISTLSNKKCKESFEGLKDTELCVYKDKSSGIGNDDRGSPLVIKSTRYLVGVSSWGSEPGQPQVYTRIKDYVNWITTIIN